MRQRLGECLIQAGLIAEKDLRRALSEHQRTGEHLGVVLERMHLATEEQIAAALASQLGYAFLDLSTNPPEPAMLALIAGDVAREHVCVAVSREREQLTVAMADPLAFSVVEELASRTGYRIKPVVATRSDILAALDVGYQETASAAGERAADNDSTPSPPDDSTAQPGTDLADRIVKRAVASRATDIYLQPTDDRVVVRYRLDGVLNDAMELPKSVAIRLIDQLKRSAGMKIGEKRLPQSARLAAIGEDGARVDFRVSTLPTMFGERLVMRILAPRTEAPALEELGLSAAALETLRDALLRRSGLLLIAGPGSSGTTTTLASFVTALRSETRNIVTIEEPIEYEISGTSQTAVDPDAGLTFPVAMRAALQQDPDVVAIGRLDDRETAALAIEAAQAGRLVLAVIRADDSAAALGRLSVMGVSPSALAAVVDAIVAQRLVRRLCTHCRRSYAAPADAVRELGIAGSDGAAPRFYEAVGCEQCHYTGYRGRIAIYEVTRVTDEQRRLIASGASADRIRQQAIAGGMVTLGEDARAKAIDGTITFDELRGLATEVRENRPLCDCGRALEPHWRFCPYCARATIVA